MVTTDALLVYTANDPLYLQGGNSQHSRIKDLLCRFPGVATKVLDRVSPVVSDVTLGHSHQPQSASIPY